MSNPIKWIAKGSLYQRSAGTGRNHSHPGNINVEECPRDINMGIKGQVFGEPVNAKLAIHFIRNLWETITEKKVLEIYNITRNFNAKVKGHKKAVKPLAFTDDEMVNAFNPLVELLLHSAGITVGKSMLLKILSQPECTGVRFYLGLKKAADKNAVPNDVFTLVMVGVDATGTDLNYKYDSTKHSMNTIPNIETRSLSGEYPATSGVIGPFGPKKIADLSPYPLFQYAISNKILKNAKRKGRR